MKGEIQLKRTKANPPENPLSRKRWKLIIRVENFIISL